MKRKIVFCIAFLFCITGINAGDMRFQSLYLEALRQIQKEEFAGAFDLLKECEILDPSSAEVKYLLSKCYSTMKNDSLANRYFEDVVHLAPDNDFYRELQAQRAIKKEDYEKAISIFEKIYDNDHERGDVLEYIVELAQRAEKYDKAIDALNRLETLDGKTEMRSMRKYHLYMSQNKHEEALNELESLAEKYPNDLNYKVAKGDYYLVLEESNKACSVYEEVLAQEPDNLQAQLSMYHYFDRNGKIDEKEAYLQKMLSNHTITSETRVYLVRLAIEDYEKNGNDSSQIMNMFRTALSQPQDDQTLATLYALYMENINMPRDSITPIFQNIILEEPANASIRAKLIEYAWEEKDFDGVIKQSIEAKQYCPEDMSFYYYEGLAHLQKGEDDQVIDVLQRGISTINEGSNPYLVSDFYSILGDMYQKKGLMREMYEAYDSCLHWKSDNIGCLNNYAYFLSLEDRDLEKAEHMSFQTVIKEPGNPTFLDTYAWILYKQQNLEGAKKYIDRAIVAVDSIGTDATIYDHAGDIYIMLENEWSAILYWTKALEILESDRSLEEYDNIEERKKQYTLLIRKIKRAGGDVKKFQKSKK